MLTLIIVTLLELKTEIWRRMIVTFPRFPVECCLTTRLFIVCNNSFGFMNLAALLLKLNCRMVIGECLMKFYFKQMENIEKSITYISCVSNRLVAEY